MCCIRIAHLSHVIYTVYANKIIISYISIPFPFTIVRINPKGVRWNITISVQVRKCYINTTGISNFEQFFQLPCSICIVLVFMNANVVFSLAVHIVLLPFHDMTATDAAGSTVGPTSAIRYMCN